MTIPRTTKLKLFLAATALFAGAACGGEDAQFNVEYAPTFHKGASTVSILGVFREGRMSPETWEEISARVSPALGKSMCPVAYDTKLVTVNRDLAEAVDDYARANGVTDDLVDQLAPAASGDEVLVLTIAGRPSDKRTDAGASTPPTSAPTPMGRSAGRGGRGMTTSLARVTVDRNAMEMTASLFSVRDHRSIAMVTMGYSGQSANEALAAFVAKVKTSFPGVTCAGWHMETKLDDKKIRQMIDE